VTDIRLTGHDHWPYDRPALKTLDLWLQPLLYRHAISNIRNYRR